MARLAQIPSSVWFSCTLITHARSGTLTLLKTRKKLEDVQKFACRLASQQRDCTYQDLLQLYELPSLEESNNSSQLTLLSLIMRQVVSDTCLWLVADYNSTLDCNDPSELSFTALALGLNSTIKHMESVIPEAEITFQGHILTPKGLDGP